MINHLIALSTLLLSISLATERFVAILKTIIPALAGSETEKDAEKDRGRILLVQLVSFFGAWITTSFLSEGGFNPFGNIVILEGHSWPVYFVAFLSTGGSAFWSSVLGYAKATKDIRQQERAMNRRKQFELKKTS